MCPGGALHAGWATQNCHHCGVTIAFPYVSFCCRLKSCFTSSRETSKATNGSWKRVQDSADTNALQRDLLSLPNGPGPQDGDRCSGSSSWTLGKGA